MQQRNALQYTEHSATHHNTLQHTTTHRNTPQHTALQHTTTHCNTLQHTTPAFKQGESDSAGHPNGKLQKFSNVISVVMNFAESYQIEKFHLHRLKTRERLPVLTPRTTTNSQNSALHSFHIVHLVSSWLIKFFCAQWLEIHENMQLLTTKTTASSKSHISNDFT